MQLAELSSNPFALMMAPEAIFAAIDRSERLRGLHSRICRPLDAPRPTLARTETSTFDAAVDASIEPFESLEDCESTDVLDSIEALDGFDPTDVYGD